MFLRTDGAGLKNTIPNPGADWFLDKSWNEMCRLDELNAYNGSYRYSNTFESSSMNSRIVNVNIMYFRHKR